MSDLSKIACSVTLDGVSKVFENQKKPLTVFQDLSLQISPGEIIALCGKSGVGKSTLLRLIAGLQPPTTGSILINGEKISKPIPGLGFVAQDYSRSLLPWLRVHSNVALPLMRKDLKITKSDRDDRVMKVLSAVGLEDFSLSFPWQLSGGMQQRVAIARSLVLNPELLILDEPFGSLDTFTRIELEDLVLNYVSEKKITTIFATHDLDEAIYMADRVITLVDRPSHTSKQDLMVDLERPRDQVRTRATPKFVALRHELYKVFLRSN